MKEQDIISAKKTIETEIIALREMENAFDESLSNALDILENTKGRLPSKPDNGGKPQRISLS